MNDLQQERLEKTLARIHKYNQNYVNEFQLPKTIKSSEELERLPFLTKEMLRIGYPFNYLCAEKSDIFRIHMSSGSTGTPIINPMTKNDVENWADMVCRCLQTATLTKNDIIQVTPTFGLFNGGFGFHFGAEKLGAFMIPAGAGRSSLQLKLMKDLGTTALAAIASYPLRLMEIAKENNFDFSETNLRVGILGAEVCSDGMRARIEKTFGIKTYDIIGMTETGGVGMGIDCPYNSGIHLWNDYYIPEIIDPKTLKVVPDGEEGELVLTSLVRQGLPLIRYRTSDITKIISRDKCECGLHTVRIARIKGRTDDMLKVKGVNFYPTQIESLLMDFPEISANYLIVLDDKRGKDSINLVLEVDKDISSDVADNLSTKIYDFFGFRADLNFVPSGTLERKDGKAKRVVDNRG